MAALAADRMTESRNLGPKRRYKMANSSTVYKGSLLMLNSSGLALAAAASASNLGIVGVPTAKKVSGTGGADYSEVEEGEFNFAATSIADTAVSKKMFSPDDQTVDETQGVNEPQTGRLVERVSNTEGWVLIGLGWGQV